jgi:two-component system cell cycle response regulator
VPDPAFRPLAVSLIRKTFILAAVCALLFSALQAGLVYRQAQQRFELALRDIARTNVPLLSVSIWDIEPEAVQRQVQMIAEREQIGYVRLAVATGQVFEAGKLALRTAGTARNFEIPHPQQMPGAIGSLAITADRGTLYREVAFGIVGVLAGYGALTLLICGLIAVMLRRELQRPMQYIADFVTALRPERLTVPLVVERPAHRRRDEIDLVAEGFKTLQQGISNHIVNLDRLVAERTAELEAALESIRQLSMTDALTGCFNRRLFNERLPQEVERAVRYQRPLSVIFSDIDFFKSINDNHGHLFGDEVLRKVALTYLGDLRTGVDWVARYGGEEFVIVLPETSLASARAIAERLRREIEAATVTCDGRALRLTASFGVAQYLTGESPQALLERADTLLFQAKAAGRNCVLPSVRAVAELSSAVEACVL